jgi:8-oxo-dGTP diphosphatase
MKHYEVVAAVIEYEDKILCMQRGKAKYDYTSYKFEFPGGKVEAGEKNNIALERELREEMDMNVNINAEDYLFTVNHTYPDFAITMHTYLCKVNTPDFVMKEHVDFKWLSVSELDSLDWAEADKPIVEWLKKENTWEKK